MQTMSQNLGLDKRNQESGDEFQHSLTQYETHVPMMVQGFLAFKCIKRVPSSHGSSKQKSRLNMVHLWLGSQFPVRPLSLKHASACSPLTICYGHCANRKKRIRLKEQSSVLFAETTPAIGDIVTIHQNLMCKSS